MPGPYDNHCRRRSAPRGHRDPDSQRRQDVSEQRPGDPACRMARAEQGESREEARGTAANAKSRRRGGGLRNRRRQSTRKPVPARRLHRARFPRAAWRLPPPEGVSPSADRLIHGASEYHEPPRVQDPATTASVRALTRLAARTSVRANRAPGSARAPGGHDAAGAHARPGPSTEARDRM